jgi:hypothetical protein
MSRRIETSADGNGLGQIRERILEWAVIIAYFAVMFLYLTVCCLWLALLAKDTF